MRKINLQLENLITCYELADSSEKRKEVMMLAKRVLNFNDMMLMYDKCISVLDCRLEGRVSSLGLSGVQNSDILE